MKSNTVRVLTVALAAASFSLVAAFASADGVTSLGGKDVGALELGGKDGGKVIELAGKDGGKVI